MRRDPRKEIGRANGFLVEPRDENRFPCRCMFLWRLMRSALNTHLLNLHGRGPMLACDIARRRRSRADDVGVRRGRGGVYAVRYGLHGSEAKWIFMPVYACATVELSHNTVAYTSDVISVHGTCFMTFVLMCCGGRSRMSAPHVPTTKRLCRLATVPFHMCRTLYSSGQEGCGGEDSIEHLFPHSLKVACSCGS